MKSISSCHYMEIRKILRDSVRPQNQLVTVKSESAITSVLSNNLQNDLSKRIAC